MTSVTKNPGAGNGNVNRWGNGGSAARGEPMWDGIGNAVPTYNPSAATIASNGRAFLVDTGSFSDSNMYRYRSLWPFDCTDLAGVTVNSAVFRIYVTAKTAQWDGTIYVCPTTQASYTAIEAADWDRVTQTSLCDTQPTVSSLTTSAYYEFTLNATGRAHIASGNGRLAILHSADFTNTQPGTPEFSYKEDSIWVNSVGAGSNKPELVIDYTPAAGGRPFRRRPSGLYTR